MLYLPFAIGCMSFEHPAIVRVSDDQTGVLRRMRVRPGEGSLRVSQQATVLTKPRWRPV
jgi:hypothetical protein